MVDGGIGIVNVVKFCFSIKYQVFIVAFYIDYNVHLLSVVHIISGIGVC